MEHAGKDSKSHMLKHTLQSGHPLVSPNDFRILQKGYNNNSVHLELFKGYPCTISCYLNDFFPNFAILILIALRYYAMFYGKAFFLTEMVQSGKKSFIFFYKF